MCDSLTNRTGIAANEDFLSLFKVNDQGHDGLVVTLPPANDIYKSVYIPERLRTWLVDLRLLRHLPIAYYVPDADLLPPESIRFFHVDATWVDRVIDGVFAAANTGTVDSVFSYTVAGMARDGLDADLAALAGNGWKPGTDQMTGMLVRTELARRWPNMIVRASVKNVPVPLLRAEPISKDLFIALFAGVPDKVQLREPYVGVRFGVKPGVGGYQVDKRDKDGNNVNDDSVPPKQVKIPVGMHDAARRTLNISGLASKLASAEPRMVALNLEQRPYVQTFRTGVAEGIGSLPPTALKNPDGTFQSLIMGEGRFSMRLDTLNARYEEQQALKIAKKTP